MKHQEYRLIDHLRMCTFDHRLLPLNIKLIKYLIICVSHGKGIQICPTIKESDHVVNKHATTS